MTDRWIRCVECNQVAHITDYDCSPQYLCDECLEEITEKPMDDMKYFMAQHKHHKIEELTVIKSSFISEGRYGEPLKVSVKTSVLSQSLVNTLNMPVSSTSNTPHRNFSSQVLTGCRVILFVVLSF